jgi:hypothetical protein
MTSASSSELFSGGIIVHNGIDTDYLINRGSLTVVPTIIVSGSTYTAAVTDQIVLINKTVGSATTIVLPSPVSVVNSDAGMNVARILRIKDIKGDAATNNILLTTVSGTIDGQSTQTISTNYASVDLLGYGYNWFIL